MTEGGKTSKLKDVKETVSGAAEIMRLIRAPGVQESFGKIMDASLIAKEIIDILKTPEMVKNIENFRLISENMNQASTNAQNMLNKLEETGVINETKGLIKSAKSTMDTFGESDQDLREMSIAIKEMFKSIRALVDELRVTVTDSKKSGIISNVEQTVRDASEIYKTAIGHKD